LSRQRIAGSSKNVSLVLDKITVLANLFVMGRTLAIHWAATTHGTWLHGDPRGSWREGRLIGPDPYLEAECRSQMDAEAVKLDSAEQALVAEAFKEIVREQRHRIFAATIQVTHVHLIVAPLREDITTVVARFKRRSAAAILARRRSKIETVSPAETAGLNSRPILGRTHSRSIPRSVWTAGKFPVFIFNEQHLVNAIEYVRDHNRRMELPPDPFDWIEPLSPADGMVGERVNRGPVFEEPRL
jgi:REP element-mobilizing transposase RayT